MLGKKDFFILLVVFDLYVIDRIIFWLSYVLLRNLVEKLFVMSKLNLIFFRIFGGGLWF